MTSCGSRSAGSSTSTTETGLPYDTTCAARITTPPGESTFRDRIAPDQEAGDFRDILVVERPDGQGLTGRSRGE